MNWEKEKSDTVHKNPYFEVRKDTLKSTKGKKKEYFIIDTPPSVFIVPLDSKNRIYLIRLYRYTTQMDSLETPAGSSKTINYLEDAKRELQEETGLVSGDWQELGTLQSFNGTSSHISTVFLARNAVQSHKNHMSEEGISEIFQFTIAEVINMIKNGEITDSGTISAIMLAYLFLEK